MTTNSIDALGNLACQSAMRGASDWLLKHKPNEPRDYARITDCIKQHLKAAMIEGLADAKMALEAGMHPSIAEQTFLASCTLAGINAAKEAVGA